MYCPSAGFHGGSTISVSSHLAHPGLIGPHLPRLNIPPDRLLYCSITPCALVAYSALKATETHIITWPASLRGLCICLHSPSIITQPYLTTESIFCLIPTTPLIELLHELDPNLAWLSCSCMLVLAFTATSTRQIDRHKRPKERCPSSDQRFDVGQILIKQQGHYQQTLLPYHNSDQCHTMRNSRLRLQ